ncbi:hypothetical protein Sjap_012081 [Stephania japonica]|uniref:Uncharacterized protein n=1 Tax=Stephania japonica TaxID=461633 RepID=A0AAP0IVF3_9MAGN
MHNSIPRIHFPHFNKTDDVMKDTTPLHTCLVESCGRFDFLHVCMSHGMFYGTVAYASGIYRAFFKIACIQTFS